MPHSGPLRACSPDQSRACSPGSGRELALPRAVESVLSRHSAEPARTPSGSSSLLRSASVRPPRSPPARADPSSGTLRQPGSRPGWEVCQARLTPYARAINTFGVTCPDLCPPLPPPHPPFSSPQRAGRRGPAGTHRSLGPSRTPTPTATPLTVLAVHSRRAGKARVLFRLMLKRAGAPAPPPPVPTGHGRPLRGSPRTHPLRPRRRIPAEGGGRLGEPPRARLPITRAALENRDLVSAAVGRGRAGHHGARQRQGPASHPSRGRRIHQRG